MPKMKTHRGAAKRYKVTGTGKLVRHKAFSSHILETKSPKRKRNLRKATGSSKADQNRLSKMMPYL